MLIVLASAKLACYPNGGGHWAWFLQYPLGLRALGHRVLWLEILPSTKNDQEDIRLIMAFFDRVAQYGLKDDAVVALVDKSPLQTFDGARIYGKSIRELSEVMDGCDLLWNFWYGVHEPLLSRFRRRAFIDVDPGHLHICVAAGGLSIGDHHAYLTVGANIGKSDSEIPALGVKWRPFRPFAYLPMWPVAGGRDRNAPFTSITQWTWEELPWRGKTVDASKRSAYLKYLRLPTMARRPFELAANIGSKDPAGDHALLRRNGWRVVDPNEVASSPQRYQQYIRGSRAEFMCPKPLHVELKTGWFSDRSVAYLASGRPVLAEDTGFGQSVRSGAGLIAFRDIDQASAGVSEIDANYERHCRAARQLAEDVFDSQTCLQAMLSACEA